MFLRSSNMYTFATIYMSNKVKVKTWQQLTKTYHWTTYCDITIWLYQLGGRPMSSQILINWYLLVNFSNSGQLIYKLRSKTSVTFPFPISKVTLYLYQFCNPNITAHGNIWPMKLVGSTAWPGLKHKFSCSWHFNFLPSYPHRLPATRYGRDTQQLLTCI